MIRCVGIDPGASTGLVCLIVPDTGNLQQAKWIGDETVRPSDAAGLSHAMRDADFHERILENLNRWQPDLVVLEEPVDAKLLWRGQTKQQTGTAFRLGAYYMAALVAARRCRARIISYPVTDHGGRPGWMQGSERDAVITRTVSFARYLRAPAHLFELKTAGEDKGKYKHQDRIMALGVLTFHVAAKWRSIGATA